MATIQYKIPTLEPLKSKPLSNTNKTCTKKRYIVAKSQSSCQNIITVGAIALSIISITYLSNIANNLKPSFIKVHDNNIDTFLNVNSIKWMKRSNDSCIKICAKPEGCSTYGNFDKWFACKSQEPECYDFLEKIINNK